MDNERDGSRNLRMDLNLYLGLPRSPRRLSMSDLGSDLALGSYLVQDNPIEMVSVGALEYHDPYSPTHATFSRTSPSTRSVEDDEDEIRQFGCPGCSLRPRNRGLAEGSRAVHEYSAFLQLEASDVAREETPTVLESLVENSNNSVRHVPYSPPYHQTGESDDLEITGSRLVQESSMVDLVHYAPYSPGYASPAAQVDPAQVDESFNVVNMEPNGPYSPSFTEMEPSPQVVEINPRSSEPMTSFDGSFEAEGEMADMLIRDDSLPRDLLLSPEFRLQRLIEANRRPPTRRFRSTVPYVVDPITATSLSPTHMLEELMDSERSAGTSMVHKVNAGDLGKRGAEDETEEHANIAANFECNVCLEMAKEPVVTSCGHLFCWTCLYQWLHLYCDHRECPVCKGQVQEADITPIYGRGNTASGIDNNDDGERDSSLKIPPRPHGRRLESARQLSRQLSLHTWLGEIRTMFGDDMLQRRGGMDGFERRNLQDIIDDGSRRFFSRMRTFRRWSRDRTGAAARALPINSVASEFSPNGGFNTNGSDNHTDVFHGTPSSSSLNQDGTGAWHPFTSYYTSVRYPVSADQPSASVRATNSGSHSGLPPYAGPSGGRDLRGQAMTTEASASSTMAVIQGDVGAVDVYPEELEANGAGTSRSMRRRRNGSSGSFDMDDGHQAKKRRRLN